MATRSGTSKSASPRKPKAAKAPDIDTLRRYVRSASAQYLQDPNITSVGVGYKVRHGVRSRELAIQFTVGAKVLPEHLAALPSVEIPPTILIDGEEIPTDVIERSFKPAYSKVEITDKDVRRQRADPLVGGISIGNAFVSAGTLGCLVRERQSKRTVILSNWHVLHGPQGALGTDIVQPGKFDDNRMAQNKIGKLLRSHLGPAGDCAIASISTRTLSHRLLGLTSTVGAIGDPALGDQVIKSGRTTGVTRGVVARIEVNSRMDYGSGYNVQIGGFEIEPDPDALPSDGEISSGGDSGAVWLAYEPKKKGPGVMLGLHYGGNNGGAEVALACYAKSVMNKLDIEPLGPEPETLTASASSAGFDRTFLGFDIAPPRFSAALSKDLATLDDEHELTYCHFSVWLSKSRKYARCVAWNIDGSGFTRVASKGFRADRRGDLAASQLSDRIYVRNPFDKGHLARRADLCWGTREEARQANYDSYYFTNIAPQHESFNQSKNREGDPEGGLWGRLENTLLDTDAPHQLRVSLMAGPVFGDADRAFSQGGETCLIPDEFWKVVAFVDAASGKEKVYGFLLSQRFLLEGLLPEAATIDLEEWLWARISLQDLQNLTGLKFARALHERESPFAAPHALSSRPAVRIIMDPTDLFA